MRTCASVATIFLALWMGTPVALSATLGTSVTYQGSLKDAGVVVNGPVDLKFTLFDAEANGNVVGATVIFDGQPGNGPPADILDGLFTVRPDFGANVFDGTALWLEIEVRIPHDPSDTAPYDTLDPRQPLTAAPIALQTRGIFVNQSTGNVGIGTTTPLARVHVNGTLRANSLTLNTAQSRTISFSGPIFQPASTSISYTKFLGIDHSVRGTVPGQVVQFIAPVQLPNGVMITGFEMVVVDNDAVQNITVSLYRHSGNGVVANLAEAVSSGASAAQRTIADTGALWPVAVNNVTASYMLLAQWTVPASAGDIQLRRVHLFYDVTSPVP